MRRRLAIAVAAALLATSPASAEDARKRAASHYQQGITHYNLGEFDKAIVEFKAAYELSREPDLLFNIGQAYRLQDDYKQALFFYDAYLRLRPDAANRADVEARIAEAKKLLDDQKSLQTAPPHGAIEPAPAVVPEPPASPPRAVPPPEPSVETMRSDSGRSALVTSGWITGAAGIACVATGIYFATRARRGWSELSQLSDERGTWSEHHAGVEDDARRSERIAFGLSAMGGAAIATGGVLWYLGWRRDRERALVTVTATSSTTTASVTWRF